MYEVSLQFKHRKVALVIKTAFRPRVEGGVIEIGSDNKSIGYPLSRLDKYEIKLTDELCK